MEKLSSSKKNIVISVIVIVVIAVFCYWYFGSDSSSSTPILSSSDSVSSDSLLTTLNELKSIALDQSIFSNPAFDGSLKDNTVTLSVALSGRPNPFAPFPGLVILNAQSKTQ